MWRQSKEQPKELMDVAKKIGFESNEKKIEFMVVQWNILADSQYS